MCELLVEGGERLYGELTIQGSKNSVLPILAATLLCADTCVIENCPKLRDVEASVAILRHLGCCTHWEGGALVVDTARMDRCTVPDALMREMRSSVIFLGAILARCKEATICYPGGCELGPRPIDLHLGALRALGAEIRETGGELKCRGGRLLGSDVYLPMPSVGATENALLCACGADLRGAGTPTIEIEGGYPLHGATYTILPDRIETATYLCACAACGGALTLRRAAPASCAGVIEALGQCGCRIRCGHDTIAIHRQGPLTACRPVTARPYPGFPTDAMPVLLAAQLGAQGKTSFTETIFENRFLYVQELQKLGAKLSQDGRTVRLQGAEPLHAARLHAGDLRGGAALVLGAMQAEGESTIFGVKHIQRGYDNLEAALQSAGARLKTVEIPIKV